MNYRDIKELLQGILPKRYMNKLDKKIECLEKQKICQLCHDTFQDDGCGFAYGYVLNPLETEEIKVQIKILKEQLNRRGKSIYCWRDYLISKTNLKIYACCGCYRPLSILMDEFINNQ